MRRFPCNFLFHLRAAISTRTTTTTTSHLAAAVAIGRPEVTLTPISTSPPLLLFARLLSSSPATTAAAVAGIFSNPTSATTPDELTSKISHLGLDLTPDAVISILSDLATEPATAANFFAWASASEIAKVNSKCYNSMLEIFAASGNGEKFWDLVAIMKKKGFGIAKATSLKASESFEGLKMVKDAALLKETYFLNSHENVARFACPEICKILRSEDEASDSGRESIMAKLDALSVSLSSDLVVVVLEKIGQFPKKALVFFQWLEVNPSFRNDARVYNVMARVLGREDCIDEFWDAARKIKDAGYELERETYVKVSDRFHKRKMLAAAVDLYRYAMGGPEKPSDQDFVFLLKKILVVNDLDLNLVTRVVRIYLKAGNLIKSSVFDGVLKSLRSVGKLGECDKVLKAMEEGGFAPDSFVHCKVVLGLCDAGKLDEALKFLSDVEESRYTLDLQVWSTLVQKYSLGGNVSMAWSCFHTMSERKGRKDVGCALEALVNGFCKKKGAKEACKVLKEAVSKKDVKPWHSTYKYLIVRLIRHGNMKEAFGLLGLMKSDGFPPFIDPFIRHILKSGTVDDATGLLEAMTLKEFPSRAVYMRLFEGLFKEGRHEVAQQLLSKSPGSVRNHADVLDLFYAMKPEEPAAAAL